MFDADGAVVGERRFLGLYTSTAYTQSVLTIPVLRSTVEQVLDAVGLPGRRALVQGPARRCSRRYPRDELFQVDAERAHRDRAVDPAHPGASADAAVHAPRPLRPLRVLHGLPPARPLHHHRAPQDARRARGRVPQRPHRLHRARVRVRARAAALRRAVLARPAAARRRRTTRSRRGSARRPDRGRTSSPTRSSTSAARRSAYACSRSTATRSRRRTRRTSRRAPASSTCASSRASMHDGDVALNIYETYAAVARRASVQDLPPRTGDLAVDRAAGPAAHGCRGRRRAAVRDRRRRCPDVGLRLRAAARVRHRVRQRQR